MKMRDYANKPPLLIKKVKESLDKGKRRENADEIAAYFPKLKIRATKKKKK